MVKIKRVYDPATPEDGKRVLIDRLWPRGIKKTDAHIDEWVKDVAPSTELRRWFSHDPAKWQEFRKRYIKELGGKAELLQSLRDDAKKGTITLLFAAKDAEHANAAVLKEILGQPPGGRTHSGTKRKKKMNVSYQRHRMRIREQEI